jgi:hypothetical protein
MMMLMMTMAIMIADDDGDDDDGEIGHGHDNAIVRSLPRGYIPGSESTIQCRLMIYMIYDMINENELS